MIGKATIARHPGLVMATILSGAFLFACVLEVNQNRLENNRKADEEAWEKILPAPTEPGIYKFYDQPDNRSCRVIVSGFGTAMDCKDGAVPNNAIESIPQPKKRTHWGA